MLISSRNRPQGLNSGSSSVILKQFHLVKAEHLKGGSACCLLIGFSVTVVCIKGVYSLISLQPATSFYFWKVYRSSSKKLIQCKE